MANYEPDGQQSMMRYAAWLGRSLEARGHPVTTVRPRPYFSRLAKHPGLSKYLGYLDKFVLFPRQLRRLAKTHDLVHILDHSNSMYLKVVRRKPNLITCHDVLAIRAAKNEFAESPTRWSGKLLQRWILSGLCGARHVLCVSQKTAEDLKKFIQTPGTEIRVIHNALNWSYGPGAALPGDLQAKLGLRIGQAYFLHVGGNLWYKNRVGVLRIFARLVSMPEFSAAVLVLAGESMTASMRAVIREQQISERVIEAANVTNDELQALYCNALALLYPSLEEGFGWPILEAQACGCPVITTGQLPMSEVAGEAAVFIDPANPDSAAKTIAAGLQDRERLRAAGFRNLERFDETAILDQYCAFYEAILTGESATV